MITVVEKLKSQFLNIGYKLGEERANLYLMFLKKKLAGEEDNSFKKLVKFKTLKRTHIESVKADNSLLEQNILNDEDIRLFVEVIEEDTDLKNQNRRYSSNSKSRSKVVANEYKSLSLHNSNSELSMTLSRSKFKKSQIRMLKNKRRFLSTKNTFSKTPLKSRLKKTGVISLDKVPSLLNQESTDTNEY